MSLFVRYLLYVLIITVFLFFPMYKISLVGEAVIKNKDSSNIIIWVIALYTNSLFYKRNTLGKLVGLIQFIISLPIIIILILCQVVYWLIDFLEFLFSYTGKKETEDKLEEDNE